MVRVSPGLEAVIVSVLVPLGVVLDVATVSVELPVPVTDVGLKVPVAPVGKLGTLKLTIPLKPCIPVTVAKVVASVDRLMALYGCFSGAPDYAHAYSA